MTRTFAVCLILLEGAEKGRERTKKTDPTAVAIKHAGLTRMVSATILSEVSSPIALAGVTLLRLIAKMQTVLISCLVFIVLGAFTIVGPLSSGSFRVLAPLDSRFIGPSLIISPGEVNPACPWLAPIGFGIEPLDPG